MLSSLKFFEEKSHSFPSAVLWSKWKNLTLKRGMSSHNYPLSFEQGLYLELRGMINASSVTCQTLPARPVNYVYYLGTITW